MNRPEQNGSATVEERKPQVQEEVTLQEAKSTTAHEEHRRLCANTLSDIETYIIAETQKNRELFIRELLQALKDSDFEYGYSSVADGFVGIALTRIGSLAREWINEVFISNYDDVFTMTSILRVIGHLDYEQMFPQGMTMALAALAHSSPAVKENGIRAFENWENPECLDILQSVDCKESWLKEYLDQVISDLKELHRNAASR